MKKKTVPAGKFKAECLGLIDRVARTRESFIVTKRGRPVVEVVPVQAEAPKSLLGSVEIRGDIVSPVLESWEMDQ